MLNSATDVNKSALENIKCFKNAIIILFFYFFIFFLIIILKLKWQASIPDLISEEKGLLILNCILHSSAIYDYFQT